MKYLAVLGRQPEISVAELEAQFSDAHFVGKGRCVVFSVADLDLADVQIERFGGVLKFAAELKEKPIEYLQKLPDGKITIGVSDYSGKGSRKDAQQEALKLKKILVRHGRSVRVVENKDAVLSTATSLHNGLNGKNERKVELIKYGSEWYLVIGVQDIEAYTKRDQKRPARDAKVGMLPPKLAQILINLCGPLAEGSVVLDPFCGTGVVLQEAILMGHAAYGTDISERMIDYSEKNLKHYDLSDYVVEVGDATHYEWKKKIDAVACEGYLGKPFSKVPSEMELKKQKQECGAIVLGFLKNLATQVKVGTPVVIAVPAWLRDNGQYERLNILDEIPNMGYNVEGWYGEGGGVEDAHMLHVG